MTKDQAEQLTVCAWVATVTGTILILCALHYLNTITRHLSTIAGAM